ncbi:hypothetical protein BJ322DRAFT_339570 [Thelephora terrestris]|uniref:C2H2-type domain-containing protein n=1 Tax=Thelephora terrestris TaxID=56493 RepID=A0A9P6L2E8_9AGAM|nr:hypothetical protein BJ322DRAFT_339570 [Thelephora terrestris]
MSVTFIINGMPEEVPSVDENGNYPPYDYAGLPDRLYPSSPPRDVIMLDETSESPSYSSSQTEPLSSGSTSSPRKPQLPLDEYLDFGSDSSDEELERSAPGDSSTTTLKPCLWEGCCAAYKDGANYSVWREHIKSAHLEQQEQGGTRRSRTFKIKCRWDGCCETFRQPQGFARHMQRHLSEL